LRNQLTDLVDAIAIDASSALASQRQTGLEAGRQFDDLSIPVSKRKHVGLLSRELDQLFLPYLRWTSH
jgi:hypothetical protein